jgi:MscS family membrane protein
MQCGGMAFAHRRDYPEPMTRVPRWAVAACLAFASAVTLGAADARAESPAASAPTPAEHARPSGPLASDVPRGALEHFLASSADGDYATAAQFLDLRKIPRAARAERGPLLASELEAVLERSAAIDPALLSDAPEGDRNDDLPANRELLAVVETGTGPVELMLERGTAPDGAVVWRVGADTVARIPALYDELGYGPFADRLPAPLVSLRLFGIRLWQWIGLILVAAIATGTAWLATKIVSRLAQPLLARAGHDVRFATHTIAPLRLLLAVAIAAAGLPFLSLALAPQRILSGVEKALVIVAFTWMFLRAIDVMSTRAQRRFLQRRQLGAVSMVPLGRRVLKIAIACLAVIAALQNFGFNVTGIAAGLGIGGLAIALAAQKTVENLFGGVTLIADQPVRVGDFCRFGDAEGVIEDIGLRSTRIRTLDRTVVTIPNAQFSAMPLENLSRRDRMPVRATLTLSPKVGAARVREVLDRLRATLEAQPKVDGPTARATFVRLGPEIEIELFAYVLTTEWNEYLQHREQIFLAALEVVGDGAQALK